MSEAARKQHKAIKPPKNMTPITQPSKIPPVKGDSFLLSKDPVVVPPSAQLAFAPEPVLKRQDVLQANLVTASVELAEVERIASLTDRARSFIPFLYSYRSITKALNGSDKYKFLEQQLSAELNAELAKLYTDVFDSAFKRICDLLDFLNQIPKDIVLCIRKVGPQASDVFHAKLTTLFDVLYNIDHMKVLKTGLVEDIRYYKSFLGDSKRDLFIQIQASLPVPNKTLVDLRDQLKAEKGSVDVTAFFTGYLEYLMKLNNNGYGRSVLMPADRSALVIGIVTSLFVLSSASLPLPEAGLVQAAVKVLIDNPIVPLYAESNLAPGIVLGKVTGIDVSKLVKNPEEAEVSRGKYDILSKMAHMRKKYQDAVVALSEILGQQHEARIEDVRTVLDAIADISWGIKALFSYKMFNIAKTSAAETTYDKGIRMNYNQDEKDALIELIGYLKVLAGSAINAEEPVMQLVSSTVNHSIQHFVQNTLEKPLVNAGKKKDSSHVLVFHAIRDAFGRWGNIDPRNTPKSEKKVKDHPIRDMDAAISTHQIDVLRVEVQSLLRSSGKKGASAKQFFKSKVLQETKDFIDMSYEWYLLVNYASVIREATNLSALYFRELYRDIDRLMQYPVRSSLPFILAEHLLTMQDRPYLHDAMTFPFEIYNDAAYTALNTFQSQYLFKEVEAELELCVDMISFTLSETIYRSHREMAAAMELPPGAIHMITPGVTRYDIVTRQNELQLLGFSVDFNQITTRKLNAKIRKELETYLQMITDIRYIPFVAHLIQVARTTHALLRERGLLLDDFDSILEKAKCSTDPRVLESGLTHTLCRSLDFPHYVYKSDTRRFLDTKNITLTPLSTEKWATAYAKLHEEEVGYIGRAHIEAMVNLMSKGELSYFVQFLSARVENELVKFIDVYTGMAPALRMNAPQSKDELVGFFNFNSDAYSELILPTLGTLLNSMRVIGNILMMIAWIDEIVDDSPAGNRLLAPVMEMILSQLQNHHGLFFQTSGIDLETVTTHRSFPAVWNILEYCYCLPKPIKIMASGQQLQVQPMVTFGEGVIIAAHVFITLCGQEPFYNYDSMVRRTLALYSVEAGNLAGKLPELAEFLENAKISANAAETARLVAAPYKSPRTTQ